MATWNHIVWVSTCSGSKQGGEILTQLWRTANQLCCVEHNCAQLAGVKLMLVTLEEAGTITIHMFWLVYWEASFKSLHIQ